jgi:hypothetical protein
VSVSSPPGATTSFDPALTAEEAAVALAVLGALTVRADDARPRGKYVRKELAINWAKFPQLGLDMKDYVFARHLTGITYDSDGFTLRSGLLAEDMYTGEPVEFRLEQHKKDWRIEIDHIVSLKDVWSSCGHRWSPKGRNWMKVANDPTNLLPVARSANRAKGNRDAAR